MVSPSPRCQHTPGAARAFLVFGPRGSEPPWLLQRRIRSRRIASTDSSYSTYLDEPVAGEELLAIIRTAVATRRALADARDAQRHTDQLRLYAAEAAALLAHDLNNGLTVAIGNLSSLGAGSLDDDAAESVAAAYYTSHEWDQL